MPNTTARPRIALIGAGMMGSLHARVISQHDSVELAAVVDPDLVAAEALTSRYGGAPVPDLGDPASYDAFVVASPTEHHHTWALRAIEAGRPVLVEKPLSDVLERAEAIVAAAERHEVPLMCGFVERFNPAVMNAVGIAENVRHIRAVRHSPYAPRMRTGVAHDLAIHDVDLAIRLIGVPPQQVTGSVTVLDDRSAVGCEDIADLSLRFPDGQLAWVTASRVAQRKERLLTITTVDRQIEVDLIRQDVTVYRHVETQLLPDQSFHQQTIIEIPSVRLSHEPLVAQLDHFVAMIGGEVDPATERASLLPAHRAVAAVLPVADATRR